MKKYLVSGLLILAVCVIFAQAPEVKKETPNIKLESLKKQAVDLEDEMAKLRVEIIQKDPDLQKLHNQIIALHRELALRVDTKREMRVLILKAEEINREMNELKNQEKK